MSSWRRVCWLALHSFNPAVTFCSFVLIRSPRKVKELNATSVSPTCWSWFLALVIPIFFDFQSA